jgi:hypothetical protein
MIKKKISGLLAAVCLILSLTACGPKEEELVTKSAPAPLSTEAPLTGFLLDAKELFGESCIIVAKTIKLTDDITLPEDAALILDEDDAYTLDLNGRKLTASVTKSGGALFSCTEGMLTVIDSKGEGEISFTASADGAALMCKDSGTIVVNGIKIDVSAPEDSGASAIFVKSGGKMTVKDGTFTGDTSITIDNSQVDLTIEGGSYSGFVNLDDDEAGIEAFLAERKRAAVTTEGYIMVS